MAITTTREAAVELAMRGLRVFPLVFRTKRPLPRSHGLHDASADLQTIRRIWAGRLLNLCVRTGTPLHGEYLSVLDMRNCRNWNASMVRSRRRSPLRHRGATTGISPGRCWSHGAVSFQVSIGRAKAAQSSDRVPFMHLVPSIPALTGPCRLPWHRDG
jgi:hypothetical protein